MRPAAPAENVEQAVPVAEPDGDRKQGEVPSLAWRDARNAVQEAHDRQLALIDRWNTLIVRADSLSLDADGIRELESYLPDIDAAMNTNFERNWGSLSKWDPYY